MRIFEVAPVTCEVPQRFLLSSDLGSTALSQLYSFFFFGFWFPNRGRGVFEVVAVSCEVHQRFQLSSDLDSTALSQLYFSLRFRLLVSEPWPWDLRGGRR